MSRLAGCGEVSTFSVLLLWALARPGICAEPRKLDDIDVFGVAASSIDELARCFGADASELVAAPFPRSRELERELERKVRRAGSFAAVDVSIVYHFEDQERTFLTFNLSLKEGKPPLHFQPPRKGEVGDSSGLLQRWREFETLGRKIGFDVSSPTEPKCPVTYCLYDVSNPTLNPLAVQFQREVPRHLALLVRTLRQDRDPDARVAAVFLLAHLASAKNVAAILASQVLDPAPAVRNAILLIFTSMAEQGQGEQVPLPRILPLLHSTVTTDRNKAAAIVAALAGEMRYRAVLLHTAGCDLVRLLEMRQPNQRDFAHQALVKLRGADLGQSQAEPWKGWLKSQGRKCGAEPVIARGTLCPLP